MATLHTVNKSPYEKNALSACLARAAAGSAILLLEDGVYAATGDGNALQGGAEGLTFFALGPDLLARGISEENLVDGVDVVDYAGFVDLTIQYDKVNPWL